MTAISFPAKPLHLSAANDDCCLPLVLLRPANDRYIPDVVA